MSDQQAINVTMRASDGDRQQVVERLRGALEDGRLSMEEFADRMGTAFQAVTYGDLAPLCADLPDSSPVLASPVLASPGMASPGMASPGMASPVIAGTGAAAGTAVRPAACSRTGYLAGLPLALKILWTIWQVAVSVNVVVWILVRDPGGHLGYPWPVWVAGPYGAVLLAVSAAVTLFRRGRPPAARIR
jgi:hypothetical protein